ncbi:MAG: hypothetical protein KDA42_14555 [Planctomycetales bacterium]|nr:hypothetical protein [Planctomycetales bacterium]
MAQAENDATDALSLYFLALAQREAGHVAAATATLSAAIEREQSYPVDAWGTRMQRVQGSSRLWIEQSRNLAGIGR